VPGVDVDYKGDRRGGYELNDCLHNKIPWVKVENITCLLLR